MSSKTGNDLDRHLPLTAALVDYASGQASQLSANHVHLLIASLIELSNSRFVQQGQETKMEQVYKYLTGTKFRQRVEAVIEKFEDMRDDLDRERRFMGKQWSKREAQILAVVNSTVGMVGDLQGIAGKAMPEIPSLDTRLLEASTDPEAKVS